MMNKTFYYILAAAGEALIIAAFLVFGGEMPENILTLNIVVASIVFQLAVFTIATPAVSLDDPAGRQAAGIGIRWYVKGLYAFAALGAMLLMNTGSIVAFRYQLIVQLVLLFVLACGIFAGITSSAKAARVHAAESQRQGGIDEARRAVRALAEQTAHAEGVSADVKARIDKLAETLRYTSPCLSTEAADTERRIVEIAGDMRRAIPAYTLNEKNIAALLDEMEMLCNRRSRACLA
ncbi:MAG: hypothetical protein K2I18_06885 [Paramuribaculum sp.]|nr:hypothetical protein [Paramuribaculum sp.]